MIGLLEEMGGWSHGLEFYRFGFLMRDIPREVVSEAMIRLVSRKPDQA